MGVKFLTSLNINNYICMYYTTGGFSMGGALAMHVGFRLMRRVAGVFALSSFLSHTSSIYQVREIKNCSTPIWRIVHTSQFNTYYLNVCCCTETLVSTGKDKVQTFSDTDVCWLHSVAHTSPVTEYWTHVARSDIIATPVHVPWWQRHPGPPWMGPAHIQQTQTAGSAWRIPHHS